MAGASNFVQIYPDSTGKLIDTTEVTVGTNTVERQRMVIGGASAAGLADVISTNPSPTGGNYGLVVIPMTIAATTAQAPAQSTVTSTASTVFTTSTTMQAVTIQNQSIVPVTIGFSSGVTAGAAGIILAACQSASDGTGGTMTVSNFVGAIYGIIVSGSGTVGVQAMPAT